MLHPMRFTGSFVVLNGASNDGWEIILGSMIKLLEIYGTHFNHIDSTHLIWEQISNVIKNVLWEVPYLQKH